MLVLGLNFLYLRHKTLKPKKMKKIYATLILSSLIFAANAQNGRKMSKHATATATAASFTKQGHNEVNVLVCDTISPIMPTDSLLIYTVGTAQGGGYVAGNNGYGDLTKATFIPGAIVPPASQITGVYCLFLKYAAGNGTKGTGAVSFNILNGDTTNGPSGASLGTAPTTMATIISSGTQVGDILITLVPFGTPVNAPAAGFFVSMTLPTTTGDTAVFFITRDMSQISHSYAWETWSDNSYHSFKDPSNWDIPGVSLTMMPVLCYNSTGIHNNVLEANMAMYPNPSNGQFNFVMTLPEATNLTVSVLNTLGQVVFTQTENNFKGGIMKYDLTSLGKGVYFANITDSNNNKVVKKIIIE